MAKKNHINDEVKFENSENVEEKDKETNYEKRQVNQKTNGNLEDKLKH